MLSSVSASGKHKPLQVRCSQVRLTFSETISQGSLRGKEPLFLREPPSSQAPPPGDLCPTPQQGRSPFTKSVWLKPRHRVQFRLCHQRFQKEALGLWVWLPSSRNAAPFESRTSWHSRPSR